MTLVIGEEVQPVGTIAALAVIGPHEGVGNWHRYQVVVQQIPVQEVGVVAGTVDADQGVTLNVGRCVSAASEAPAYCPE